MRPWLTVGDASDAVHWQAVRSFLNTRRHELSLAARHLYPALPSVAGTPLLTRPQWLPEAPVPLEQVTLSWADSASPGAIDGTGPPFEAAMPARGDGSRFGCYADALAALSRPAIFENRSCYRLLRARAEKGGATMTFGPGRYFDLVNTSEAIAHEYAAAVLARGGDPAPGDPAPGDPGPGDPAPGDPAPGDPGPSLADLPLRSLVGDPTDLGRRRTMVATCTLVLRADRACGDTTMVLHWRDAARVATGGGLYLVAPAGMFQPSDDAPWNQANDFDLWRSIVRELAEELLGADEDHHSGAAPVDYENWPLYAELARARQAGTLRVFWLGIGTDPLTMATDILTVAVFDAEVFDAVFAGLVSANDEGRIVTEDGRGGVSFCEKNVERFAGGEPMQAAGAALLRTAWAWRGMLLG